MNEEKFLAELEEILNVEEPLTMEIELKNLVEWDSLTALMFQSFIYKATKNAPAPADIRKAETIRDLFEFVK